MTNTFMISVIIPNYNYKDYIVETLESVAAQTYGNWECIIVDDGSTDDSRIVIEEYVSKNNDNRFKPYFIANSGTSAAKNYGLTKAKGKLIQFLDADDIIGPTKFATTVEIFKKEDCTLVFSKSVFFTQKDNEIVALQKYPHGYLATTSMVGYQLIRKLIKNNFATISAPIVKIEYITQVKGFVEGLNQNEDWLFWSKIALIKATFIFDNCSTSMVRIRIHNTSAMTNSDKMFIGEKKVRIELSSLIKENNTLNKGEKKELLKLNNDLLALHEVRSLSAFEGFSYIWSCFLKSPVSNISLLIKSLIKFAIRKLKRQ